MKPWNLVCTGLVMTAALASDALAQGLPAITPPPGLAIAPQPPPVNAPAPPAALPPNIWDQLMPRADQKAACKAKICNSRIGQLFNNMLTPIGAFSGGILGPCCPTINAADLAKPPDSAEGAAAQLKLDEADAKARREAIRYMAGADCHYWPEVTLALIGSLHADRNECVRLEAALALGRGCCCNRATMKALTLTVSSSTEDGNPPEDSERVKMAALAALNHCLANYTEVVPAPEPIKTDHGGEPIPPKTGEPIPPPTPTPPMTQNRPFGPTEFYHHAANLEEKKVVEEARRAVEHVTPVAVEAPSPAADHTLFGIVRAAATPPPGPVIPAVVVMEKPTTHPTVVPAVLVQPVKSSPPPVVVPVAPPVVVPVAPPVVVPVAPPVVVPVAPPSTGVAPAGYFSTTPKTISTSSTEKTTPTEKTIPPAQKPAPVEKTTVQVEKTHPAAKATIQVEKLPPPPVVVTLVVPAKPAAAEKAAAQVDKTPVVVKAAVHVETAPPAPAPIKRTPTVQAGLSATITAEAIGVLRDSIQPEERAKAADVLGACDGWANPGVVQALIEAARSDADPPVRAACLRSLSRMNVRTLPVATIAQALRTDPDPHVRTEAEQVLKQVSGSMTPHAQ